jgi:acylphosphatase
MVSLQRQGTTAWTAVDLNLTAGKPSLLAIKHRAFHSNPMISLQVFYEGHVQGVGFRFTVRHAVKGFDVTGWIRNLPDGRVELQVSGEEGEVRAFLDRVAQGELHSLIHKQTENKLNKPVTACGFEIRYD